MKATKLYNCIVPRFDGFYTDNIDLDSISIVSSDNGGITLDNIW